MLRVLTRPVATKRITQAASMRWLPYSTGTSPLPDLDEGERRIYDKLNEKFTPSHLQVQDVSGALRLYTYYGSQNADSDKGGCGSFYAISITSKAFSELSTLKQHRLVTDTLKADIKEIHGLQVRTLVLCFTCGHSCHIQLKTVPETN